MTEVRILRAVAADVAEAANWHARNGYVGLGERFESTFYASVERLRQTGQAHRVVHGEFRRILLRPFPYALYDRIRGAMEVVVLIIHQCRSKHTPLTPSLSPTLESEAMERGWGEGERERGAILCLPTYALINIHAARAPERARSLLRGRS